MADVYKEELPDQCPPPGAQEIQTEFFVFRLVSDSPATDRDFMSQRAMRPNAKFPDECIARGLSVWMTEADAANTRRLPRFRTALICRVALRGGAGKIMQTFKPGHRTWWPLTPS